MTVRVACGHLHANLRECWLLRNNLRLSATHPDWTAEPTVHAVVVETIDVEAEHRQQGECRAFLESLCADPRFEMVVVEGVGNKHLAEALLRWGWDCDPGVMDFYHRRTP